MHTLILSMIVLLNLHLCHAGALTTSTLKKVSGSGRVIGVPVTSIAAPTRSICSAICLEDKECNGYNYHPANHQCEILSYAMVKQLTTGQDADGWELWLPETCLSVGSRPSFTEHTVSMNMEGHVLLSDIYCVIDGNETLTYLNLQHNDNYAHSHAINQIPRKGTRFTKFQLSLPELTIVRDDYRFASFLDGYTENNEFGIIMPCTYNVVADYILNLSGTSFKMTDDTVNTYSGYLAQAYINSKSNQYARLALWGQCGNGRLQDNEGKITLRLVD